MTKEELMINRQIVNNMLAREYNSTDFKSPRNVPSEILPIINHRWYWNWM